MIEEALRLLRLALEIYAKASGPPIDLAALARDAGVEIARIDDQQARDEAAEDAAISIPVLPIDPAADDRVDRLVARKIRDA